MHLYGESQAELDFVIVFGALFPLSGFSFRGRVSAEKLSRGPALTTGTTERGAWPRRATSASPTGTAPRTKSASSLGKIIIYHIHTFDL